MFVGLDLYYSCTQILHKLAASTGDLRVEPAQSALLFIRTGAGSALLWICATAEHRPRAQRVTTMVLAFRRILI